MNETWWEVTPELRWHAPFPSDERAKLRFVLVLQQKWVQKQFIRDEYVIAEEWRDVPMVANEKTP